MKDDPIMSFPSQAEWEAWLAENGEASRGVWLKLFKKQPGVANMTYDEALEGALIYGWVDGQKASLDNNAWLQRFSPRRGQSKWSKINTEKVERLIATGRMQPEGLRHVEAAKADGRWDVAYAGQKTATVPDDLAAALAANTAAQAMWERLNSVNRYAVLYRLQDAKKPETRAARLEKFVGMLERGETLYPQKG